MTYKLYFLVHQWQLMAEMIVTKNREFDWHFVKQ